MEFKTLALDLGKLQVLQDGAGIVVQQEPLVSGWYVDPRTGQRIFFDANARNFYTMAGGVYLPLMSLSSPPKQVNIAPGDRLKIDVSFKYTGPAITGASIRYCVGPNGAFGFTEQMVAIETFNIPQVTTPPAAPNVSSSHIFSIPTNVGTDWTCIYVKMYGGTPSLGSEVVPSYIFGYQDALVIVGTQPSITEFKIADFAKV
jgi:hypothetical protein